MKITITVSVWLGLLGGLNQSYMDLIKSNYRSGSDLVWVDLIV